MLSECSLLSCKAALLGAMLLLQFPPAALPLKSPVSELIQLSSERFCLSLGSLLEGTTEVHLSVS